MEDRRASESSCLYVDSSTDLSNYHNQENDLILLKHKLVYLSTKDQFKWQVNDDELQKFIKCVLNFENDIDLCEDRSHNLLAIKTCNIIVKWWRKALVKRPMIVDDSCFPRNYHQLSPTIIRVVKRKKLSLTIMKNLNKLKMNDSC